MSTLFFKLPRLVILCILLVVIGGLGAVLSLGRQEDPTLVERYGYVLIPFPGADAERIEALITEPVEAALMELPELGMVSSVSRAGLSQVLMDIDESLSEAEVEDAWTLIRAKIEQARSQFPPGAGTPELTQLYVGASTLIVSLTWEQEGDPPLAVMRRLALDLEDRFQRLPGTEETETFGMPDEEVRVVVDPSALSAAGLSFRQAAALIASADSKNPAGRLRSDGGTIGLQVGGEFEDIARIRDVPLVQRPDGSAVRVSDVATVEKGYADPLLHKAFANDRRTVLVGVYISSGQRVDKWAETARAVVDDFSRTVPAGLKVETAFDQSAYTSDRLRGLAQNLVFSALIVILVLFVTMGWRSAIVVGMAIPLTVSLVLILFNIFGHPLHQMSVTGLVISLGLLIDNAIVVVDEFDQLRARGRARIDAVRKSLGHLAAPLAASTLTTALAFAPIALLPGGSGEFVGMIGVSVIFSVISSFVISLTIIPAMAGWFDRRRGWETGQARRQHRWWRDGVSNDFISDGYRATVEAVLRYPLLGIVLSIAPAIAGVWLVRQLPYQFFPATERDQFQVVFSLPASANPDQAESIVHRATNMIRSIEGVESVTWVLGEPAPRVYYNTISHIEGVEGFASGWVQLDGNERTHLIVGDVQRMVRKEFPTARFLALPFEQGPPVDAPIELRVMGDDFEILDRIGDHARSVLAGTPGVTYTAASLELGAPTIRLEADEAASALAGERLTDIAADLSAELDGVRAGSVLEGTEELPVRVIAPMSRRSGMSELRSATVGDGAGTPIAALGDVTLTPETAVITRRAGQRMNQILAYLDPYTLPSPVLENFQERFDATGFHVPDGYDIIIGGEAESADQAASDLLGVGGPLLLMMAGAIMLVFNSFRMMLLVLTTGFLALGLAFFGVWLFNLPFGFIAIVGGFGLFGIAINGSIVVLSLLRASPAAMADDIIAQREIVVDATRHIVATTLTTMGGFIPILLAGDSFWMPLAAGISGGVAGSALLALYFTPAVFRITTMKPVRKAFGHLFNRREMPAE